MRRSVVLVLLFAALAACNSSKPGATTNEASGSFPVTIGGTTGSLTIESKPTRIVSLSATATEMLYSIDAGAQVVAVDDQSNYPGNAPKTKLSGYDPNVEAITGYQPDLVVIAGDNKGVRSALTKLSIVVLIQPAAVTIDDSYRQIEDLGKATGHTPEAAHVVEGMKTDIASIIAATPHPTKPITFYHELDSTYFSVTSSTFIGKVYSMLGLKNIADPADKKAGGYPQLSAEYIIQADPDVIFLADIKCCKQDAATVRRRAGWSSIRAVKNDDVIPLDDDIASRWGPRIVEFMRVVSSAITKIEKAA